MHSNIVISKKKIDPKPKELAFSFKMLNCFRKLFIYLDEVREWFSIIKNLSDNYQHLSRQL